jgi:hypothetical protein
LQCRHRKRCTSVQLTCAALPSRKPYLSSQTSSMRQPSGLEGIAVDAGTDCVDDTGNLVTRNPGKE